MDGTALIQHPIALVLNNALVPSELFRSMNGERPDPWESDGQQRVVPIVGSHNLRDMGGYPTVDGFRLRWGKLYRSGLMAGFSEADRDQITGLGIVAICDLRATEERERKPMTWHHGLEIEYWARDYGPSLGELDVLLQRGEVSRQAIQDVMSDAYVKLPYEQSASYRVLFEKLAAGRLPLVFNCTAGKDRTGIAAALILTLLGVPRDVVEHDYSLTERGTERLRAMMLADPRYAALGQLPPDHYMPLLRADPAYLTMALAGIEERSGSIEVYLRDEVGITDSDRSAIREKLLEKR